MPRAGLLANLRSGGGKTVISEGEDNKLLYTERKTRPPPFLSAIGALFATDLSPEQLQTCSEQRSRIATIEHPRNSPPSPSSPLNLPISNLCPLVGTSSSRISSKGVLQTRSDTDTQRGRTTPKSFSKTKSGGGAGPSSGVLRMFFTYHRFEIAQPFENPASSGKKWGGGGVEGKKTK